MIPHNNFLQSPTILEGSCQFCDKKFHYVQFFLSFIYEPFPIDPPLNAPVVFTQTVEVPYCVK